MKRAPLPTEDLAHVIEHAAESLSTLHGSRLFITGGTGFFGKWLVESLLYGISELALDVRATLLTRSPEAFRLQAPHIANHPAVSLLQGDIRSFDFPSESHSHFLHAATDVNADHAPAYEVAEAMVQGTHRVLECALACNASRFLFTSSGAVYGEVSVDVDRIAETYRGAPDPLRLRSTYGEAKRMSEHLCVAFSDGQKLQCSVARCFAFVGPHLPLDRHFAIGNFVRDALNRKPIQIDGDGSPLRSFLYMSDLAIWLWTILVRGRPNRAYNVGSDQAISIKELARLTANTLGTNLPITIGASPIPGTSTTTYVPDISRARAELGLSVRVPLEQAIRKTAAWHRFAPDVI